MKDICKLLISIAIIFAAFSAETMSLEKEDSAGPPLPSRYCDCPTALSLLESPTKVLRQLDSYDKNNKKTPPPLSFRLTGNFDDDYATALFLSRLSAGALRQLNFYDENNKMISLECFLSRAFFCERNPFKNPLRRRLKPTVLSALP